jgi:hypothetical protein
VGAVVSAHRTLFLMRMGDCKSIQQLIDEYYPELAERLNNGKRERK